MTIKGNKEQKPKRPSFWLLASEGGRAVAELGLFCIAKKVMRRKKQSDGAPVVVIPGFMTTDKSTRPMRGFLNDLGYKTYGWKQGRNLGDPKAVYSAIDYIKTIYAKHQQKISLVGWSLGGVYAREVAKEIPEMISQVITLGSPFSGLQEDSNAAWVYQLVSGQSVKDLDSKLIRNLHLPPPVPVTAIYTKGDGIVSWEYCIEYENRPDLQNVQVQGSHCGLGFNLSVLNVIANRLDQSVQEWKPFQPSWLQVNLYPNLATA